MGMASMKDNPYEIEYRIDTVNIENYPKTFVSHQDDTLICVGDLHGNALKLLHFLIKHQIATGIDVQEYQTFEKMIRMEIHTLQVHEQDEYISQFDALIRKVQFDNRIHVVFTGDMLADRGNNDYYTLKIIEAMHEGNCQFDIIYSNHDSVIFYALAHGLDPSLNQDTHHMAMMRFSPPYRQSLSNMISLLEHRLTFRQQMIAIIREKYLPHVKLLMCTLASKIDRACIYTHAPCDLRTIKALAEKMNVTYLDESSHQLAESIAKINAVFKQMIIENSNAYQQVLMEGAGKMDEKEPGKYPIEYISWNRRSDHLNRGSSHHNYKICYVHGHDSTDVTQDNIFNLEQQNTLGKTRVSNIGELCVLVSHDGVYY